MARGRDWRRFQRNRTIHRKVDILRGIGGDENVKAWTGGGYIGVLSKNKIHCSCWMCRAKSYDEPAHSDWKAQVGADQQVREYLLFEEAKDNEHIYPAGEAEHEGTESVS